MENLILIILCISIGYIFQRTKILNIDSAMTLNKFVIYISLPALILLEFPKIEFSISIVIPVIIAWSVMLSSIILVLLASKIFSYTKEVTGALLLMSVLANTIFVGIPVLKAYYGEDAIPYILMYEQMGTFIFLTTYAPFIISVYSSGEKFNIKAIGKKIITFPPFLAFLSAIILMNIAFPYPKEVTSILSMLATTIVPMVLVAVGLQLKFKMPKKDLNPFFTSLSIKLILSPIIAISICSIFGWHNLAAKVAIFEAGMPANIAAGAMAGIAGLAPRLCNAIIGYGIIFSFLSTSILYLYLG